MAVFGQIYQTGADAYQLFMVWSLLIFGWTLISKFSAQWALWLVVTNLFLTLWWEQSALPSRSMVHMIFTYLILLNGLMLVLYEYFAEKISYEWLNVRWLRILLTITVLNMMARPICILIVDSEGCSTLISSAIGAIGHVLIYLYYRYKRPDILSLAFWVLSICIIVEFLIAKVILELDIKLSIQCLLGGIMTLCVFSFAVIYLRKVSKQIQGNK